MKFHNLTLLKIANQILLTICFLSGCVSISNKPFATFTRPSFQNLKDRDKPIRVAVRTSFADGSEAVHCKRANAISIKTAELLNDAENSHIEFFPVREFDNLTEIHFDYLLKLDCNNPSHELDSNELLLLLGWPATLSIIAAPLGVLILSIPGIVEETATFDWTISLVPKYYESLELEKQKLPTLKTAVDASGWGASDEVLEESYINMESHLEEAAIKFVNDINWDLHQKKVYAASSSQSTDVGTSSIFELSSPPFPSTHSKRFAVVVGISRYKYASKAGFANLHYADDDARDVAIQLEKRGWPPQNIKILLNEKATKREVEIAVESWLSKAREHDLITLFWSGHGYPDPEDPQKVYFACYDTNVRIPSTGLRMDRVRNMLEERCVRNVVVLADTCHAGKLITRGGRDLSILPYIDKIKREENVPKGWVFMVSADSDRLAIENSSWRNGAFTHVLLKALSGSADGYSSAGSKDNIITLGEMKAYMVDQMPEETLRILGVAKHPIITTSTGDPKIWRLPFIY